MDLASRSLPDSVHNYYSNDRSQIIMINFHLIPFNNEIRDYFPNLNDKFS
jgi:hypothetical protein